MDDYVADISGYDTISLDMSGYFLGANSNIGGCCCAGKVRQVGRVISYYFAISFVSTVLYIFFTFSYISFNYSYENGIGIFCIEKGGVDTDFGAHLFFTFCF